MHGKRGQRHYSSQPNKAKIEIPLKMQLNLASKFKKQIDANKLIKTSPHRLLSFTSHSSSSQSFSSHDNDDYYEDFLQNVIYEKKKSRSHKASKYEYIALQNKMKKHSKKKKLESEDKRKKNKRASFIKLHLAEVQEEKNSNVNTIRAIHPQRNMNQFLTIKKEESFSINNETKQKSKLNKVVEDARSNIDLNSRNKAKEDVSPISNKGSNQNRGSLSIYNNIGLSSCILDNKAKKHRRISVFDHHIGLGGNSNNFDDYILNSINKKPRLSISPVRIKRDKMIKISNKKENPNDNWKNAGQIPNAGHESVNVKDKSGIEVKKEEAINNNIKKGNQIEKQLTPPIDTLSKQSSMLKKQKKKRSLLFCCIPIK